VADLLASHMNASHGHRGRDCLRLYLAAQASEPPPRHDAAAVGLTPQQRQSGEEPVVSPVKTTRHIATTPLRFDDAIV